MSAFPPNLYGQWRAQCLGQGFLCERDSAPPERLLQAIWHHQRVLRDQLKTVDGRTVRVLHPGFWNREAGPDFRGAMLRIGDEIKSGDIEIDLVESGWRGHGHDRNPNFRNVILHIVWQAGEAKTDLPLLPLHQLLDAPLEELVSWLGSDAAKGWPAELSGNCCAPLRNLSSAQLTELLQQAALVRFQRKAHELQFRARQVGWEQALWEGIFRALGYKRNIWPMQRIGELAGSLVASESSVFQTQARLLGISGLVPAQLPARRGAHEYVRQVWDVWWRERDSFADAALPRAIWKLNALRPANHPERRLALAAHWLTTPKLIQSIEETFASGKNLNTFRRRLLELLQVDKDDFWTRHWTFRSGELAKPQPMIGEKRITDLAINVILPWFWIRATAGKNQELQQRAQEYYFAWPPAEDNAALRGARQRLLAEKRTDAFKTAAAQQGMLQILRDFCEHSDALCANCRFPDLVRLFSK